MGYATKETEGIIVGKNGSTIAIEGKLLNDASLTLRAIKHPLRKEIVELVNKNGEMTVTQIFVSLRIEQSVASQHLAVLRSSNWLKTNREGKFIKYSVNLDRFKKVSDLLTELA